MRLDARMSQADTAALGKDVALRRLTLRRIDADPSNPRRQDYLARFADREGREFLARFYRKYAGKPAHEAKTCWCTARGRRRRAWPPRSTVSNPTRTRTASQSSSRGACPTPISPTRRCRHCATRSVRTAGRWPTAATWRRAPAGTVGCGLPAPTSQGHARRGGRGQRPERQVLTPSYASALGASGDWPAALAELMGIIVNRGMRLPVTRVASLQFARGTKRASCASRRRPSACSSPRSRRALIGVVEEGTAKRLNGALIRRVWQRGGDRWQDGHGRPPLRHLRARRPIALFARGEPFGDPGLCCPWSTASPAASHSTIGSRPGRCAARRAETFTLLASAARNCSTWAKVMMDPGIAALPRQRPAAVGRGAGSVCSLCSSSAA